MTRFVPIALGVLLLSTSTPASQDDGLLKALSRIGKQEAVKILKDRKEEIQETKVGDATFTGHVQAIDPQEQLGVEVKEFNLSNDLLKMKVTTSGRFKLSGKLKQGESTTDITAILDLTLTSTAEAKFAQRGDDFFVTPTVKDLELKLNILELTPSNLSGGTSLLSSIANLAFKNKKVSIIEDINASLGERKLEL